MELTPEIRQRLRSIMEEKGETGYTLNKKLGISASTIGNYIKDDSHVKKADNIKLSAICDILEISLQWLEFGDIIVQNNPFTPVDQNNNLTLTELLKQILLGINLGNEKFNLLIKSNNNFQQTVQEFKKEFTSIAQKLDELTNKIEELKKE